MLCILSIAPLRGSLADISPSTRWAENGVTVVGGNGAGMSLNQLSEPHGLYIDEDNTVFVADTANHRIVAWKYGETSGTVVAGGNGGGDRNDQLNGPTDMIVHKETDSLIICDRSNLRVMQWPRYGGTTGKIIVSGFSCYSLTTNNQDFLYVSLPKQNLIRRFQLNESNGTIIAGGHGEGDDLRQLHSPYYIYVDRDNSLYISDEQNHRVMKWVESESKGSVVAGGHGCGNNLEQLCGPQGVVVDQYGTVYVAELWNHRITRWLKNATQGSILAGDYSAGKQANQLNTPEGLSFDRYGNLYVVDRLNNRVQKYNIKKNDGQQLLEEAALNKASELFDSNMTSE
ncbi:unnamed protein product [Rotaria sp. Silwood1]|nr:unnamed protein product [Rotaria sp. Silwood1]